jgi:hypothetical protein
VNAEHSADYACKAEPERQTLRKHLREHGRATPAHVWASRCRWCRLGDPYNRWKLKRYEAKHNDGSGGAGTMKL